MTEQKTPTTGRRRRNSAFFPVIAGAAIVLTAFGASGRLSDDQPGPDPGFETEVQFQPPAENVTAENGLVPSDVAPVIEPVEMLPAPMVP